jgi:hypothetical protein
MRDMISKHPDTPLGLHYWSTTPYRLGPHAVKWSAFPTEASPHQASSPNSGDKLRKVMSRQLQERVFSFDFAAQLQTDPESMPIEDPRREWDEQRSPWRKLATLKLPVQTPDTPERMEFCEHLSFNPWRCLPEHRPLGGVNRARKAIYEALAARRHELNEQAVSEPTIEDLRDLWDR